MKLRLFSLHLQIAKVNGKDDVTQKKLENELHYLAEQQEEKVSLLQVFNYPKLRLRTIVILMIS